MGRIAARGDRQKFHFNSNRVSRHRNSATYDALNVGTSRSSNASDMRVIYCLAPWPSYIDNSAALPLGIVRLYVRVCTERTSQLAIAEQARTPLYLDG
jgi:hypothetical protein